MVKIQLLLYRQKCIQDEEKRKQRWRRTALFYLVYDRRYSPQTVAMKQLQRYPSTHNASQSGPCPLK